MSDNVTLNAGSGGAVIATDDDGTAHHQYVKLEFGADNTQTKVTSSAGLPVAQQGTWTVQPGNTANTTAWKVDGSAVTQPVSIAGTVTTSDAGRSAVLHFQTSIPTTAGGTQLASNACKEATVKNLLSNSNIIWVGITGVSSSNGYELNPGESLTLKVSNTNLIYCLSASGSQTVCTIATN